MKLRNVCSLIFFVILCLCNSLNAQIYQWDFENNELRDKTKSKSLRYTSKSVYISETENGKSLISTNFSDVINIPFQYDNTAKFQLGLKFRGTSYSMISLTRQLFRFDINEDYFSLKFSYTLKNKTEVFNLKVPLNTPIPYNGNYLSNGKFHDIVLIIDGQNGKVELIIDDTRRNDFIFDVKKFEKIIFENNGGFRLKGALSKISINNNIVINKRNTILNTPQNDIFDPKDFAKQSKGFVETTLQQLNNYPSPRFVKGYTYKRNFPWFDITYFSWTHQPVNSRGKPEEQSLNAVNLMSTLHDHWNYYFEIPILRVNETNAKDTYSNKKSISGALINYAKARKDIQTAGILLQIQNNPKHIGLDFSKNLEWSNSLESKYYLKDSKGTIVLHNNKKVLSPLAPLDFKYFDAKNSVYYLQNVYKYLGRPIDFLNENGEIYGHKIPNSVFQNDPNISKDLLNRSNNNNDIYNGYFQNKLDTAYKNSILRSLNWKSTLFSFYNVSAYNSNYWPDYSQRRTSNNTHNNIHYSTPSFYPASATNWYTALGARNGLYNIIEGRSKEIKLGDKLFSPFISAGWDLDEKNILPSQWLALNKVLVLFGAEYFYTGYFNVTGRTGWANGKGPNDPRGYLYQLAVPVYAQALFPYMEKFIINGEFVGGEKTGTQIYKVPASKSNHLVYVKKSHDDYIIVGSIQRNANYKNLIPNEELTEINIEGKKFRFKIRSQGSIYILNKFKQSYIIRQIDSWHEHQHPSWWSKESLIEGELLSNIQNLTTINTITAKDLFDFSEFKTLLKVQSEIQIPLYYHNINFLKILAKGSAKIEILNKVVEIKSDTLKMFEIDLSKSKITDKFLNIKLLTGTYDIDHVLYSQ